MKLSIIIVNYNVRYFLEQCLLSVRQAARDIEHEIFVVDNASSDGSTSMLQQKFPGVKLIENRENLGFAKANNQALRLATGQYQLLLNPDTVVQENSFQVCLRFMDAHPEAGALGVKMMDGQGNFLPESKRGLPTPWVSFYKIFGLSQLFPRSPRFARYHLGHLSPDKNHAVEVLAGAFMLLRQEALKKTGLLDEDFFMYGEDIDLSYRILQAGYQNYYLADTSIIHYKGESTKKGSLNYVFIFYRAMAIFARKHFRKRYAKAFQFSIHTAIVLRAGLSVVKRIIRALWMPALDAGVLLAGLYYIKEYWEHNHRFVVGGEYPPELVWTAFPLYTLAWLAALFFTGSYERPARLTNILKAIGLGSVVILVGYSLVAEIYRFSRAIIILGSFWAALAIPGWRVLLQKWLNLPLLMRSQRHRRLLIVGRPDEASRVAELVKQTSEAVDYLGKVAPGQEAFEHPDFVGAARDLPDLARLLDVDEVIFCSRDVPANQLFHHMTALNPLKLEIKIAPSESEFVIGSNSIDSQGAWYTVQFNAISKATNRRAKRLLDVFSALLLLFLSPFLIWGFRQKGQFYKNAWAVLRGRKTWVGYDHQVPTSHLPPLRTPVIQTTLGSGLNDKNPVAINHINQLYAKDYNIWNDIQFILAGYKFLGDK